jgi:outer membrane protein, multidrug efflux system
MKKWLWIFLLFVSGCNFKPHYNRPQMELSESWRFDDGESSCYANIAWWEQFKDPLLTEHIRAALQNNQNLQVATARVCEYMAKYQVALSQFYPQIYADVKNQLSFSQTPLSNLGVAQNSAPSSVTGLLQSLTSLIPKKDTVYHFLFTLLPYEVDFWGKIRNSVESAKYSYFAQINNRRGVIVTLTSQLALSYFQLIQFDNQLRIAKETYDSRQQSYEIALKRYEAGLTSLLEVKQAETQAEDAAIAIQNFTQFIAQQEDLISTLIGAPPGPIERAPSLPEFSASTYIPAGLPADLLENRPDILQAEDLMISANAQIGVARANFLPQLTLSGAYGWKTSTLEDFLKRKGEAWSRTEQLNQPLFTGWKLTEKLSEAEAIFLETYHSYQQTVLTALQEVNDALITHKTAKEKWEIQNKEVAALTEYLRLSQLRYENGLNDYLTVLNAETSLFQVQLNQVNSQAQVFTSLINLYKALGQGWSVECEAN